MLPVMITKSLLGTQHDTILSGVIYFWVSGAYGLAATDLHRQLPGAAVQRRSSSAHHLAGAAAKRMAAARAGQALPHARGDRPLVDARRLRGGAAGRPGAHPGLAEITAGVGIAAFGAVVVLTMLASLSFDPRLTWDTEAAIAEQELKHATRNRI